MDHSGLTTTHRAVGITPVLAVSGNLDERSAPALLDAFAAFLDMGERDLDFDEHQPLVGIDLSGTTAIDGAGRDAILACRARASAMSTAVILFHPSRIEGLGDLGEMTFSVDDWA